MKWLALLILAAAFGCAPVPSAIPEAPTAPAETPSPPAQQGEDTCGMAQHQSLIGKRESEIDRAALPPGARIICPQCMVTQDFRPNRLNLFTSTEGRVASMRCF
ncbi:MAG: hypothetical protein JNJ73_12680 [Hyphomonadaceae bacterium]|nr:hypothetical protein [Hyphomonadaceae bacterium]